MTKSTIRTCIFAGQRSLSEDPGNPRPLLNNQDSRSQSKGTFRMQVAIVSNARRLPVAWRSSSAFLIFALLVTVLPTFTNPVSAHERQQPQLDCRGAVCIDAH